MRTWLLFQLLNNNAPNDPTAKSTIQGVCAVGAASLPLLISIYLTNDGQLTWGFVSCH